MYEVRSGMGVVMQEEVSRGGGRGCMGNWGIGSQKHEALFALRQFHNKVISTDLRGEISLPQTQPSFERAADTTLRKIAAKTRVSSKIFSIYCARIWVHDHVVVRDQRNLI